MVKGNILIKLQLSITIKFIIKYYKTQFKNLYKQKVAY